MSELSEWEDGTSDPTQEQLDDLLEEPARTGLGKRLVIIGMSVLVLLGSVFGSVYMLQTVPRSRRRKARPYATLVKFVPVRFKRKRVRLDAMGTVQAAQQVTLFPRVRGEVVRMNKKLIPGGLFRRGEWMLRIDPADYALVVAQRKSALAQAKAALALEQGQQLIARRELRMLGQSIKKGNRPLMLRKPQLATANANVKAAQAALSQARLNLRRTYIRAPFDAVVMQRSVNKGTRVTESTAMFQIAGTRSFWIELAVAVDQLKWIELPRMEGRKRIPGSKVKIFHPDAWGTKARVGRVIRLYPTLQTQGRMARVLVEIDDPLSLKKGAPQAKKLLLGSYVKAQILGRLGPHVAILPREFLRDNDSVWLISKDNKLIIRPVHVLYRGRKVLFVDQGLRPGDRVISTLLPTPISGMPLRTEQSAKRKRKGGQL